MDFIPGLDEVPFEVYLERGIILVVLCVGVACIPIGKPFKIAIGVLLFFMAFISVLVNWDLFAL